MARVQTMVQLNHELLVLLDAEAARRRVSRSALIRSVLEESLRDAAIGRRIVGGYRRIPPATPDEWGEPDRLADEQTEELLQRLDADERAQGRGPW